VAALATWAAISHVMRWTPAEIADWRARGVREVPNVRTKQVLTVGTAFLDDTVARSGTARDIPAAAARLDVPWLIVHGKGDETVPFEEARTLHHGAHRGRTTLLWLGETNHTFDSTHPMTAPSPALMQATRATADFFRSALA
jgi:pimeloyl-ACP methyl ester carboxylesterase